MKLCVLKLVLAGLICLVFLAHSQGDNFATVDAAISEMEQSLDMPRSTAATGAEATAPILSRAPNVPVQSLAGIWHLELANGESINLILSQSGRIVFGRGNVTSSNASREVTVNGFNADGMLGMNVVPVDGSKLYTYPLTCAA